MKRQAKSGFGAPDSDHLDEMWEHVERAEEHLRELDGASDAASCPVAFPALLGAGEAIAAANAHGESIAKMGAEGAELARRSTKLHARYVQHIARFGDRCVQTVKRRGARGRA